MTSAATWDEARRIYGQTPIEGAASFKFMGRSMQSQMDAVALATRLQRDDAKSLATPQKLAMMTNSTRDAIRMLLGIRGRKWKWDPEDLPAAQRQALGAAAEPAANKLAAQAQAQVSISGVPSGVQAQELVAFVNDCLFQGGADSISVSDGKATIACTSEASAAWVAARLRAVAAAGYSGMDATSVQAAQEGSAVTVSGLPADLESQRLADLLTATNTVTAQGPRLAATVSMANAEALELALALEDATLGGSTVTVERVAGTANQVRVLNLSTTATEEEVVELLGGEEAVKSTTLAPGPRIIRFHSRSVAEAVAALGKASVAGKAIQCSFVEPVTAAVDAADAADDDDDEEEEEEEGEQAAAGSIDLGGSDRTDLPGLVLSGVPLSVSAVALAAVFDSGLVTGLRMPTDASSDAVVAVAGAELREALAGAMSGAKLSGSDVAATAVAPNEEEEPEEAAATGAGRRRTQHSARVDRERREKEELNAAWRALQQSEKERVERIVKEVEAMCADISKAFNTNRAMYQGQWDNFDETVEPRRVPRPARFNIPHPQRHIASLHKWDALKAKGAGPLVNMMEHESFNNRWADADSGGAFMDRTVALFDEFCDEDAFYNGQFSDDNFIIPEDFEVKRYLPDSVKRQIFFLWSYKNMDLVTLARKFKTTTDRISAIVALQKTEPEQIAKGTYDDSIEKMLSRLVASDWAHLSDPDWDSPLDTGLDVAILPDTTLPEDGVPLRRWKGHRLRIRAHVEPTNGRVLGNTEEGKQERFRHRSRSRYSFKDISEGDRGTGLNSAPYVMVDYDGVRRPASHRERLLRHGVSKWFLPRRQGGGENFLPWSKAEFDRTADVPAAIAEDVASFRARRDAMYADHVAAKAAAQAEDA